MLERVSFTCICKVTWDNQLSLLQLCSSCLTIIQCLVLDISIELLIQSRAVSSVALIIMLERVFFAFICKVTWDNQVSILQLCTSNLTITFFFVLDNNAEVVKQSKSVSSIELTIMVERVSFAFMCKVTWNNQQSLLQLCSCCLTIIQCIVLDIYIELLKQSKAVSSVALTIMLERVQFYFICKGTYDHQPPILQLFTSSFTIIQSLVLDINREFLK